MARKKEYIEEEVIEKAMVLFWRNGYEATSVRMLEKAMGINQFSIYSSFGSKQGLFLKSIHCYEGYLQGMIEKLRNSTNGVEGIKTFFYDSINTPSDCSTPKGCLVTNTLNEFANSEDKLIKEQVILFTTAIKELFIEKLREGGEEDEELLIKQSNYLLIAKQGLSVAAKVASEKELSDYIEMTFRDF
ncbi:TetR/AcrR family transcriptional regulator [Ancylomarina sp. 16SWW S1-10-2]|uniref:TetR/AcrR family transcriptional regulator n=1 Tax=Ancylomarina sp. 16SWW S1-10-2 TaxID=2499681 RepID=UPI0012AD39D2|nr:TetR/AcrR family transcriptional regulator [Ancylomarina sp. 16SWW S1-10-2]MRT92653.1 TetR/AcrR family transcriptional regulator [Ancylomarina sp. 16SWW S1-10-2]